MIFQSYQGMIMMSVSDRDVETNTIEPSETAVTPVEPIPSQSDSSYVLTRLKKKPLSELKAQRIRKRMNAILWALQEYKAHQVVFSCIELGAYFWSCHPEYFNDFN